MSEESEPGTILDAIKKKHSEDEILGDEEHHEDFIVAKHFVKEVQPSEEVIDSLLAEIES